MRRAHDVLARECKGLRQASSAHRNTLPTPAVCHISVTFHSAFHRHLRPTAALQCPLMPLVQALQHAQHQLAASTGDSMKVLMRRALCGCHLCLSFVFVIFLFVVCCAWRTRILLRRVESVARAIPFIVV